MNTTTFLKNKIRQILPILFMLLSFNYTGLSQIMISQYIETSSGTSPKGIEVWNNSGSAIDFSTTNLIVKKGTNGGTPSVDITISSGTLNNGDVWVIGTSDIGTYLTNQGIGTANYTEKAFTFNGDDALEIWLGSVKVDVFGNPESDPGSEWTGNGVSTKDQNIGLKSGITTGDTDGWTDPSERFETITTDNSLTGFGEAPTSSSSPTITVSPTSLTGLDYVEGSGPSSSQSFTVEGSNLTTDIAVTPSTNYEISTDNTTFQSTVITLTQSSGAVASTTIYTRLKAGLTAGNYNENITCASTGADSKTIACSGTVTGTSTPIVSDAAITESAPYYAGDNVTLTWNSNNVDYVNIYVFIPEDSKWEMFLSHTASDGSEVLSIPADASYGTTYKLMVAYVTDTTVNSETSDFEIRAVAANISDLRNNNNVGDKVKLTGNAVVTYIQSYRSQKYIQDANAAILIDDNSGIITSTYAAGDEMPGLEGTLNEYRGMLQFIPIADPGNPTASGLTVTPTELTLSELNSNFENYEAQLVTVKGVKFTSADGSATFANGSVYPLANSTDTFDFRTSFYNVNYISTIIPSGKLDITGILNARDNDYITACGDTNIADNYGPNAFFNITEGQTKVHPAKDIIVTFGENVYKDASQTAFTNNEDVSSSIKFYSNTGSGWTDLTANFTATILNDTVTITLNTDLPYNTSIKVEIQTNNYYDANGNGNEISDVSFTTNELVSVTFNVDMSIEFYEHSWDSTANNLDIYGDPNNYSPIKMTDTDKDLTYSATIDRLAVDDVVHFRFRKNGSSDQEALVRLYTIVKGENFTAFYNNETPTEEANFKYFKLHNQVGNEQILTDKDSVYVTVLFGTDVSNMVPDFDISPGAMVTPTTNEAQDFRNDVKYNIASYGETIEKEWWVHVTVLSEQSHEAEITALTIPEQTSSAVINSTNATVNIEVAWNADITNLTPDITISAGATISPASGVSQNFTNPVNYTVTAENGTIKAWTVTVTKQQIVDVTFNVNMNKQIKLGNFTAGSDVVNITGSFNSWTDNVCDDSDADGIYTFTATNIAVGSNVEYKFKINNTTELSGQPNRVFVVESSNNDTTVWYNNIPIGSVATVSSLIYTVDNTANTITDVLYGTNITTFKGNLIGTDGATFEVYQSDGTTIADTILTGYLVKVTSEDNSATKTYTVTVNSEPIAPAIFISEVADPADNYKARFIEIYNASSTAVDLTANNVYLVKQANAGSYYNIQLNGTIASSSTYVVAYDSVEFNTAYGFYPNIDNDNVNGNGDDGYFLYYNGDQSSGTLLDAYGVPDEDGTGKDWEYTDGRAERISTIMSPNATWTVTEWTITKPADAADMTPGQHTVAADTTAPTATFYPENNSTGVATSVNPTVTFNEDVFKTSKDEDVTGIISFFETGSPENTVTFAATISERVITIIPTANLNYSTQYSVILKANSVADASGNKNKADTTNFTTIGESDPIISNVAITESAPYYAGDNVTLTWNSNNVDKVNVYVFVPSDNEWMLFENNIDSDGSEELTIPADAGYGTTYKVMVAYVTDTTVNSETNDFEIRAVAATITDLRNNNNLGDIVKLSGNAVVTYAQNFRHQKYIQDANAAIIIDDQPGVITTTYTVGDQMTGLLGKLSEYGGMLQFIPQADPGQPTATGVEITPQVITITEFNSNFENYESELITIKNVAFVSADGTAIFENGKVYFVKNNGDSAAFRTTFYGVDYIGTVIPDVEGNVTGIVNQRNDGNYFTARNSDDLNFDTGVYKVTFNVTDENSNALSNAQVIFNQDTISTSFDGKAVFNNIEPVTDAAFKVVKENYQTYEGTVTVTDADVTVDVTLTAVGINENQSLLFDIYPNPSNGKIHVNFNKNINNIQLVVTDVRGKVIVNKKINQNENMIDLSGNKPGIYFIRVNNKDNVYTGKIILK